jgi:hypothetical protein
MPPVLVLIDLAQGFNCFRHGELLTNKTGHETATPNLSPGF